MIVLDTNVLSELMRTSPDQAVLGWLDSLPVAEIATTAITAAEHAVIEDDFASGVEPFDAAAAETYPLVVTARENAGRPIAAADAQIAAICRTHHATLATRNVRDFQHTGIELVNPWEEAP